MSTETKKKREKKVYSSFSDIVHVFANEPGRDVRCRNGFVKDDVLYSYGRHFPVAKRYTDAKGNTTIFFTLDTYGRITGKHINEAFAATRHLNKLYMKNVPRFDTVDHAYNIGYWLVQLKNAFTNIQKARNNKAWKLTEMRNHLTTLKVYLDFFKIKLTKEVKQIIAEAESDKWEKSITEFAEKEAKRLADPNLAEKREKARLARERAEERANAEQIQKWRNFEAYRPYQYKRGRYYSSSSQPDLLRYNAETERIETSQNVKIPVEIAHKFYRYIQIVLAKGGCTSAECCNYKLLDSYQVTEITNEHIKVGCHRIKIPEIQLMATKLGWVEE